MKLRTLRRARNECGFKTILQISKSLCGLNQFEPKSHQPEKNCMTRALSHIKQINDHRNEVMRIALMKVPINTRCDLEN